MYINEAVIAVISAKDIPIRPYIPEDRPTFNIKSYSRITLPADEFREFYVDHISYSNSIAYDLNVKEIMKISLYELGEDGKRVAHVTLIADHDYRMNEEATSAERQ